MILLKQGLFSLEAISQVSLKILKSSLWVHLKLPFRLRVVMYEAFHALISFPSLQFQIMPKHGASITCISTPTVCRTTSLLVLLENSKFFSSFNVFAPVFLRRLLIASPQHLFYFERIKMHQSLTHSCYFQGSPTMLFIWVFSYTQWQGQRPAGCVVSKKTFYFVCSVQKTACKCRITRMFGHPPSLY